MKAFTTILLLFLFTPFINFSQSYIYQEEFDSKGSWTQSDNDIRELYTSNGKYYFIHKKEEGSREFTTRSFTIDFSRDFEIETSILKVSGEQDYAMSFLYDYKDEDNYSEFGYTATGYYRIAKAENSSYSNLKSFTESSYIKTGNYATNKLKIKKSGNRVTFYINGNYVHGIDFKKFMGNKIALKLYRQQKIAIDYIRVKYTDTSTKSSTSTTSKTILFEGFNNKNNGWSEINTSDNSAKIINGDYIIERKISSGGYAPTISKKINTSRDFRITAQIKKVSGVNNNGFGIVFGRKDTDNQNQFFISSDGSYIINKSVDGNRTYIKNWTQSSAIKTGNGSYNYLKVQKKGSLYKFYINSKLVYTTYTTKFYGDRVGFIVYDKIKFLVGYLSIAYEDDKKTETTSTATKKTSHIIKESILFDGFTSNKNDWSTTSTSEVHFEVSDGDYKFNHKRESGGWSSTIPMKIDTSRDFKILADIKKESGTQLNGYGISFCRQDSDNQNLFFVNGNGSFAINKIRNGTDNFLKKWTPSNAVKKGNGAYNVLKVIKIGTRLEYYVNNIKVYTDYNPSFPGDRTGFVVYDKQKISIAYISVGYLDEKKTDLSTKTPTKSTSDNISNYTYNDTGFHFSDQFENNDNKWFVENDDKKDFKIKNGKYYLKHKRDEKGWATYDEHSIDTDESFEIETKIDKISGVENYGYGLIFGKNDDNDFRFYISSKGYYKIAKTIDDKETIIQKWTKTSLVKTGNSKSNILKVKKRDGYYKFYINGSFIYKMDYLPFYGNELGFVVFNNQEIAVDYLRVKYLD